MRVEIRRGWRGWSIVSLERGSNYRKVVAGASGRAPLYVIAPVFHGHCLRGHWVETDLSGAAWEVVGEFRGRAMAVKLDGGQVYANGHFET